MGKRESWSAEQRRNFEKSGYLRRIGERYEREVELKHRAADVEAKRIVAACRLVVAVEQALEAGISPYSVWSAAGESIDLEVLAAMKVELESGGRKSGDSVLYGFVDRLLQVLLRSSEFVGCSDDAVQTPRVIRAAFGDSRLVSRIHRALAVLSSCRSRSAVSPSKGWIPVHPHLRATVWPVCLHHAL